MQRPTSHGKGFTLSADDFPVLVSKNSQSNSQQGDYMQQQCSCIKSVYSCSCSLIAKLITLFNNKSAFPVELMLVVLKALSTHTIYVINVQHMFFALSVFLLAGHSFQGRPTFSSVTMAARDEQRKILTTGILLIH
jgi:hypothetical protein